MKIHNLQLVMSLVCTVEVHFTHLCDHHDMVQTDPCMGALLVGLLFFMLQKKTTGPVYFI